MPDQTISDTIFAPASLGGSVLGVFLAHNPAEIITSVGTLTGDFIEHYVIDEALLTTPLLTGTFALANLKLTSSIASYGVLEGDLTPRTSERIDRDLFDDMSGSRSPLPWLVTRPDVTRLTELAQGVAPNYSFLCQPFFPFIISIEAASSAGDALYDIGARPGWLGVLVIDEFLGAPQARLAFRAPDAGEIVQVVDTIDDTAPPLPADFTNGQLLRWDGTSWSDVETASKRMLRAQEVFDIFDPDEFYYFYAQLVGAVAHKLQYDTQRQLDFLDVDRCPDELLPHLARTFGAPIRVTDTASRQRATIAAFMPWSQKKGLQDAVQMALRTIGYLGYARPVWGIPEQTHLNLAPNDFTDSAWTLVGEGGAAPPEVVMQGNPTVKQLFNYINSPEALDDGTNWDLNTAAAPAAATVLIADDASDPAPYQYVNLIETAFPGHSNDFDVGVNNWIAEGNITRIVEDTPLYPTPWGTTDADIMEVSGTTAAMVLTFGTLLLPDATTHSIQAYVKVTDGAGALQFALAANADVRYVLVPDDGEWHRVHMRFLGANLGVTTVKFGRIAQSFSTAARQFAITGATLKQGGPMTYSTGLPEVMRVPVNQRLRQFPFNAFTLAGVSYRFSAWVKVKDADVGDVKLHFQEGGAAEDTIVRLVPQDGRWHSIGGEITLPVSKIVLDIYNLSVPGVDRDYALTGVRCTPPVQDAFATPQSEVAVTVDKPPFPPHAWEDLVPPWSDEPRADALLFDDGAYGEVALRQHAVDGNWRIQDFTPYNCTFWAKILDGKGDAKFAIELGNQQRFVRVDYVPQPINLIPTADVTNDLSLWDISAAVGEEPTIVETRSETSIPPWTDLAVASVVEFFEGGVSGFRITEGNQLSGFTFDVTRVYQLSLWAKVLDRVNEPVDAAPSLTLKATISSTGPSVFERTSTIPADSEWHLVTFRLRVGPETPTDRYLDLHADPAATPNFRRVAIAGMHLMLAPDDPQYVLPTPGPSYLMAVPDDGEWHELSGDVTYDGTAAAPANTNLTVSPQTLANAVVWIVSGGVTVTENPILDPQGGGTAERLDYTSPAGSLLYQDVHAVPTDVSGLPYTASVWLRADGAASVGQNIQLELLGADGTSESVSTTVTLTSAWVRYTLTDLRSVVAVGLRVQLRKAQVGVLSVDAWGFQVEQGWYATPYIVIPGGVVASDLLVEGSDNFQIRHLTRGIPQRMVAMAGVRLREGTGRVPYADFDAANSWEERLPAGKLGAEHEFASAPFPKVQHPAGLVTIHLQKLDGTPIAVYDTLRQELAERLRLHALPAHVRIKDFVPDVPVVLYDVTSGLNTVNMTSAIAAFDAQNVITAHLEAVNAFTTFGITYVAANYVNSAAAAGVALAGFTTEVDRAATAVAQAAAASVSMSATLTPVNVTDVAVAAAAASTAFSMQVITTNAVTIIASQVSGPAPLPVYFEASINGSGVTNPFHNLLYVWSFGEIGAGTWTRGNTLNTNKNVAQGPMAAHVFDEDGASGVHSVTVDVYKRTAGVTTLIGSNTIIITAISQTAHYNITGKCVSYKNAAGTHTGKFSTAEERIATTVDWHDIELDFVAGVRAWQFQKGDTFTIVNTDSASAGWLINGTGPCLLQSVGSGAHAVFNEPNSKEALMVTRAPSDQWTFDEIKFSTDTSVGTPGGHVVKLSYAATNWLFLNCDFGIVGRGITGAVSNQTDVAYGSTDLSDGFFVIGCRFGLDVVVNDGRFAPLYFAGYRVAIMGCLVDGKYDAPKTDASSSHTYRMYHQERSLVQHNLIRSTWGDKSIQDGSGDFLDIKFAPAKNMISQGGFKDNAVMHSILISDNHFDTWNTWCVAVKTQSEAAPSGDNEHVEDIIVERNYFIVDELVATHTTSTAVRVQAVRVTVRNNLLNSGVLTHNYQLVFAASGQANSPAAASIWVYGNSTYHPGTGPNSPSNSELIAVFASNVVAGTCMARNNVGFAPQSINTQMVNDSAASDVGDNLLIAATPYVSLTPSVETDFRLELASTAEGVGGEVLGLIRDYEDVGVTIADVNLGAYQNHP